MEYNERELEELLRSLSEEAEEVIAEEYPPLDDAARLRILKKCGLTDQDTDITMNEKEEDIDTVTGTEIYKRPVWYKLAASAAAFVLAAAGIGGAIALSRNGRPDRGPDHSASMSAGTTDPEELTISGELTTEPSHAEATDSEPELPPDIEDQDIMPVTVAEEETTASTTETTTDPEETTSPDEAEVPTETSTAPPEEATTSAENAKLPEGYWVSESSDGKRYWEFFDDGTGGMYADAESGMGLGFLMEIQGTELTFHIGSVDDLTPAQITWHGTDSFTLRWTESGLEEEFLPDPEEHINN
ncbi:MAG: hypothetical protein IJ071_13270 [Ruminococcus sp.]|nr:hypothetical protein [Ruminococcus sp.]